MRLNVNHTDRVIFLSEPDRLLANRKALETITNAPLMGPYEHGVLDAQVFVSMAAGLQIIAPMEKRSPSNTPLYDLLEQRGEGVFAICFGVPDIHAASARARDAGYRPSAAIDDFTSSRWAQGASKVLECAVTEVLGTKFIYTQTEYPDEMFSPDGDRPGTTQNVNRLDHVVWLSKACNFDQHVRELAALGGSPLDGPHHRKDKGIRVAISCNAGLELITPPDGEHPFSEHLREKLGREGEGVLSIIYGVDDIVEARERIIAHGYSPDDFIEKDYTQPWAHKTISFRELVVGSFMNASIVFSQIVYPDDIFVTRK